MKNWLRNIRKERRLTQNEMAKRVGFARTYYTRIECGTRGSNLPIRTAKTIANVLGFDWKLFYEPPDAIDAIGTQEGQAVKHINNKV